MSTVAALTRRPWTLAIGLTVLVLLWLASGFIGRRSGPAR